MVVGTETAVQKVEAREVTAAGPKPALGLVPRDVGEAYRLAQAFAQSGMFAVRSPEACLVILMTGMELGLGPAQSLRSIFVVEGKPTLSAQLMVALCKSRRDVCEYFTCVESTDQGATYETKRVGEPRPQRMAFTMEDAKRAQVVGKGNWSKFPAAMSIDVDCARQSRSDGYDTDHSASPGPRV